METYKIEKNVPLTNTVIKYPQLFNTLKAMKIGDSFIAPSKFQSAVNNYARALEVKVATRKAENDARRFWLIANVKNKSKN